MSKFPLKHVTENELKKLNYFIEERHFRKSCQKLKLKLYIYLPLSVP